MSERTSRSLPQLDPAPAWTIVTDAPLQGLALAREAGRVLAWDEADSLCLLDLAGQPQAEARAPGRVLAAAISDDGSLVALAGQGGRLWLLGPNLEVIADRSTVPDALTLTVDPHGRYVAVTSKLSLTQFHNRAGKQAGRFESRQALAHVIFIPAEPILIGTSSYGTILALSLSPERGSTVGALTPALLWQENLMSNVGRLTATGDGRMILVSCFTHGVQRYDPRGRSEGSFHLGGSAAQAVVDFAGRTLAVSTLEGELAILNPSGQVRWRTDLPRPALALEADALGRFLIYGLATGEITRLDLDRSHPATSPSLKARAPGSHRGSSIRSPDWSALVAASDDDALGAVLTVLDEPPRIGVITKSNRLQVFTTAGQGLGRAPEVAGVGRFLRTCPGWIAAATDRQVVLYQARRNTAHRLNLPLAEITHLALLPDSFGLALVQERDRIGRATAAGEWVWKHELRSPIEDLAIGPDGLLGATTEDGLFLIVHPAGQPSGPSPFAASEPLNLIAAPLDSPAGLTWITLARRAQRLRGHDRDGGVLWEASLPWEPWQLIPAGPSVVVSAPDGRALAFDHRGSLIAQGRDGDPQALVFPGPGGVPWRVVRQGVHLICSDLTGQVAWRTVADAPLGPLAAARSGVAALIGRSLAWFSSPSSG